MGEWDYAHRGLHGDGVPENSPSAFAEAIQLGIGIELDVQRSRDGKAVVFHDWEFDRLTAETGAVSRRDAAEIETIRLNGNDDAIPLLARTLEQIAGQVPVLIEIKSRSDNRAVPLCMGVQHALEGYRGEHAIMSFDPRVSRWFAVRSPRTVRGLVVTEEDSKNIRGQWKRRLAMWHARPDFLAYDVRDLPSKFAAFQRKRGLPLLTWTVKTEELQQIGQDNADALIAERA